MSDIDTPAKAVKMSGDDIKAAVSMVVSLCLVLETKSDKVGIATELSGFKT